MKIGIAVTTTPNRENVFQQWYNHYAKMCPELPLYIHNDINYQGVSYSKNKCINALYEVGCDYLMLFDDDCFIKKASFTDLYINSGLNHACWNYNREKIKFGVLATTDYPYSNVKLTQFDELEKPNGCMLFVTRKVIDKVGGFDMDFKGYGYDHVNWSDRIFNNGLTPARYIDIPDSSGLFEMADCNSSFTAIDRAQIPRNLKLYQQKYYSKEFKPFK